MAELAYQELNENNTRTAFEEQMFEQANNFEVKQVGKNFLSYFDLDNGSFTTRHKNNGKGLDDAYIEDFNTAKKISDSLRIHLVNDYGFNSDNDFESFKIVSASGNTVYMIDKNGCEHPCFGTKKDNKSGLSSDIISIKYSKVTESEPKCEIQNKKYDCVEMCEFIKTPKVGNASKVILRVYDIDGKKYATYDWLNENEKKKKTDNFSTIKT